MSLPRLTRAQMLEQATALFADLTGDHPEGTRDETAPEQLVQAAEAAGQTTRRSFANYANQWARQRWVRAMALREQDGTMLPDEPVSQPDRAGGGRKAGQEPAAFWPPPHAVKAALEQTPGLLKEREETMLRLRYGLDGHPPRFFPEVGEAFLLSGERARQIVNRSLRKLGFTRDSGKEAD